VSKGDDEMRTERACSGPNLRWVLPTLHLSKCGLQRVPDSLPSPLQLQSHGHRHHDFDAAGRTGVWGAESAGLFVSFFPQEVQEFGGEGKVGPADFSSISRTNQPIFKNCTDY
jgi:hypothetical protein